jgi:hypothetical protein
MRKRRPKAHELLKAALENPHPETLRLAVLGFDEWARTEDDCTDLLDPRGGTPVRWCPERGWVGGDSGP